MPRKDLKLRIEEHYWQEFFHARHNPGAEVPRTIIFYLYTNNTMSFIFQSYKKKNNPTDCAGKLITEIAEQNKYSGLLFEVEEPKKFMFLSLDIGELLTQITIRGNKDYLKKTGNEKPKIDLKKLEEMITKIENAATYFVETIKKETKKEPLIMCKNYYLK